MLVFFADSANISWHVCSASSPFRLWSAIFLILSPFFSTSLFYFDKCFEKKEKTKPLSSPNWARLLFFYPPFFYYHGGFTNVHQRFGDERDEIILIPALPLSRSNSLTKLSDSILAPAARVNLLCHLQSTRGSAKSHFSLCQNPPTVLLFRSIKVCPPFSLHSTSVCLLIFLTLFSVFVSVSTV